MKPVDVLVLNNIGGGFDILVKRLPNPHETIMMKQMRLTEDLAKGGNVAVALARLGVSCAIIGKIGDDEAGKRDLGWMQAAGVDTGEVLVSPDVATGQGIGIIAENGDNILITGESSSEKLTWEEVQAAMLRRRGAGYFITGLEVRMPLVLRAIQLAKQLGMRVMFNPSPVPEGGLPAPLHDVDDFFVNEVEAQLLLGLPAAEIDNTFDPRGVCEALRARYQPARVFLTLGAKGSQLVFRVAIPQAMPSILQGMTQGMSSACVSLMVAEMLGVEAGLGWYITWAKAWAMYNRLFAAIVVICLVFNAVTKSLNLFKKRVLRWQEGMVK